MHLLRSYIELSFVEFAKVQKIIITPQTSILDAGSGNGLLSLSLASMFDDLPGVKISGVDCDSKRVETASVRAKMVRLDHRLLFSVQDLTALQFEDAEFDLIVCADVIEHIQEDERAMRELQRVTKPNGKIILSTVTPTDQQRSFLYRASAEEHGHVREGYSKGELERLVEDAGYTTEGIFFRDRYLDRLAWEIDCIIGQRNMVRAFAFPLLLSMAKMDALLIPSRFQGNNMTIVAQKRGVV